MSSNNRSQKPSADQSPYREKSKWNGGASTEFSSIKQVMSLGFIQNDCSELIIALDPVDGQPPVTFETCVETSFTSLQPSFDVHVTAKHQALSDAVDASYDPRIAAATLNLANVATEANQRSLDNLVQRKHDQVLSLRTALLFRTALLLRTALLTLELPSSASLKTGDVNARSLIPRSPSASMFSLPILAKFRCCKSSLFSSRADQEQLG